jgi:hypothetical protein
MASKLAAVMILILCALVLGQGCSTPGGGGGPSGGTQTTSGIQSPAQGTQGDISPGPVVTVPLKYDVQIQENRNHNPVYPNIIVTFRGGNGQIFLQKIVATVVRSDGQVITKELDRPENGQISVGDSMTFTGTTSIDRVIVLVTILGKDYKIIDMNDDYNSHP